MSIYYGLQNGIVLTSGFSQKNPVTIASNGVVTGTAAYNGDAVYGAIYNWTVTNNGTVTGAGSGLGIHLAGNGLVTNKQSGSIAGGVAIQGTSGAVSNFGTIAGSVSAPQVTNLTGATIGGGVSASGVTNKRQHRRKRLRIINYQHRHCTIVG
jgi:hypothetical protein